VAALLADEMLPVLRAALAASGDERVATAR
jgi:hypothetical protein